MYLSSGLGKDLILLQHAVLVRFGGDFEEGDSFDEGHFVFCSCS